MNNVEKPVSSEQQERNDTQAQPVSLFDAQNDELIQGLAAKFKDLHTLKGKDTRTLSGTDKKLLEPISVIYNERGFGKKFLSIILENSSLAVPYDSVVHLAKELKALKKESFEETMVLTRQELEDLSTHIHTPDTDKITEFIAGQQAETVTLKEIKDGSGGVLDSLSKTEHEAFDQIQDVTYGYLAKYFNEGGDSEFALPAGFDEDALHNMATALTIWYVEKVNVYVDTTKTAAGASEKPKKFTLFGDKSGLSKREVLELARSGPFGPGAVEVFSGLDDNAATRGLKNQFDTFFEQLKVGSLLVDESILKSPGQFHDYLEAFIGGKQFVSSSTADKQVIGGEIDYTHMESVDISGLDQKGKKVVTSFVKHYKEARHENMFDSITGLKGMLKDVTGIFKEVLGELEGVFASLGFDSKSRFGSMFSMFKTLSIQLEGGMSSEEKSVFDTLTNKFKDSFVEVGLKKEALVTPEALPTMDFAKSIRSTFFEKPEAVTIDKRVLNKIYKTAPLLVKQQYPRVVTDLMFYNALITAHPNASVDEITTMFKKARTVNATTGAVKYINTSGDGTQEKQYILSYVEKIGTQLGSTYAMEKATNGMFGDALIASLLKGPVGAEYSISNAKIPPRSEVPATTAAVPTATQSPTATPTTPSSAPNTVTTTETPAEKETRINEAAKNIVTELMAPAGITGFDSTKHTLTYANGVFTLTGKKSDGSALNATQPKASIETFFQDPTKNEYDAAKGVIKIRAEGILKG